MPSSRVTIRVPSQRQEQVRDLVRCRETFQREILKSRHYILKFLSRRGLLYREGQRAKHFAWLRVAAQKPSSIPLRQSKLGIRRRRRYPWLEPRFRNA